MAISILVMGESGTGKSTSIRHLKPEETYIIEVIEKPLPFQNKYKKTRQVEGKTVVGNLFCTDEYLKIIGCISHINSARPEIKNIVIDDFQYIMANEFMRKSNEKGYQKFTDLAKNTWSILNECQYMRSDLTIFFLTHSEESNGRYKAKTIGKMLDEKITFEGLFTIVLHTQVLEEKYLFLTQNDGVHIAKSPMGMFSDKYIENDLNYVKERIEAYYTIDEDVPM